MAPYYNMKYITGILQRFIYEYKCIEICLFGFVGSYVFFYLQFIFEFPEKTITILKYIINKLFIYVYIIFCNQYTQNFTYFVFIWNPTFAPFEQDTR